jgi:hypothetical protein
MPHTSVLLLVEYKSEVLKEHCFQFWAQRYNNIFSEAKANDKMEAIVK